MDTFLVLVKSTLIILSLRKWNDEMPPCCVITLHTIELPDICLSLLKGPTLPRWFYSKIRDVRTLFIGWVSRDMACIFYIYIHWQNMYNTAYTNHYKLSSFFVQIHLVPLPSPGHSPLGVSDCEQLLLLAVLFLVSLREFTNRSNHKHYPYNAPSPI